MLVYNSMFNSVEKTALQMNVELQGGGRSGGGGGPFDFIVS